MKIKEIAVDKLRPYEKNAKKHPEEQVARIAASLREFGFQQPIVVDKNNVVIIGHGRLAAAQKLGIDKVPCVQVENLTQSQIKALRLADNKTAESEWDLDLLLDDLSDLDFDMEQFGFDISALPSGGSGDDVDLGLGDDDGDDDDDDDDSDDRPPSATHNVFENQECMQFAETNYYGIPQMRPTSVTGDKMWRFCDWRECENPAEYIAHFYYDDFKFISAWREPDKYIERLRMFKAVVSPDFSLYTDFPRALQILSCYRRQWCGAYWQLQGLNVIPDVVWGDKESFSYCFEGIPKKSTVAVSTVGVKNDKNWNGADDDIFKAGYMEMMNRLEPTTVMFYGDMIDGLPGNIIHCPSFYAQRRDMLNEKKRRKDENGQG